MGTWDYLKYWVRGRNQCRIVTSQHTLINSYQSNVIFNQSSLLKPQKTYTLQRLTSLLQGDNDTYSNTTYMLKDNKSFRQNMSLLILFCYFVFWTVWTHILINWQWKLWTMYFKNNLLRLREKEQNINMKKCAFIKKRFDEHVYELLLNLLKKKTKKLLLDVVCVVSGR